jgi:hypothetical protein
METAEWLQQQGIKALPYHAGLDAKVRQKNQERFLREDGIVVVATIAFGMGIDKPDVQSGLPSSLVHEELVEFIKRDPVVESRRLVLRSADTLFVPVPTVPNIREADG